MRRQAVNAELLQMILDEKLVNLFGEMNMDDIKNYIEKLSQPEFGKTGIYNVFCKSCGGSWNFETKEDRRFFEKFHKYTGCALEVRNYTKEIKEKVNGEKVVIRTIEGQALGRSSENISTHGADFINMMIAKHNKLEENGAENESTTTALSEESQAA